MAVLAGGSCGPGEPGPPGFPVHDYRPPEVAEVDGIRTVANVGPAERLNLYPSRPSGPARLLFMERRAAAPLPDGGAAWPDPGSSRVVVFDRDGFVRSVLQGGPAGARALSQPYFAAHDGQGVRAVELGGAALRFVSGEPVAWLDPPLPWPVVHGDGGVLAASRTIFSVETAPVFPGDPLLWVRRGNGAPEGVGSVRVPDRGLTGALVNSGWVAVGPGGDVFFAAALRPELSKYEPDGSLAWQARWPPARPVEEPRFRATAGMAEPVFKIVQAGLALGPDDHIYVLAPGDPELGEDVLLVFDRDGRLLRRGVVDGGGALFVDRKGRVHQVSAGDALYTSAERSRRIAFPPFELERLDGSGTVSLDDLRGRVVVLNFWASWCAPCRKEMPLLDAMADSFDPERAVLVGLNEDILPDDAIRFLEEVGVDYANLRGGGELKERYGYRGLPYTVVLDPDLDVAASFYGFGSTIDPIERAVGEELGRSPPP